MRRFETVKPFLDWAETTETALKKIDTELIEKVELMVQDPIDGMKHQDRDSKSNIEEIFE
jgi:hypothetical protein